MQKMEALIEDLEREAIDLNFCVTLSSIYLKDENALNWLDEVSQNSRYFKIDDMLVVL